MPDELTNDQIAYYRARATEYDLTSYVDVEAARPRVERIVAEAAPAGRVLELACGTGVWTRALAGFPGVTSLTAVDAAPEAIALARERCPPAVRFEVGDLFAWAPEPEAMPFDLVFFGFWLSHVPTERVPAFFARLGSWLAPDGRVVFVDEPGSVAMAKESVGNGTAGEAGEVVRRRLRDGSEHRLVKVALDPPELVGRLHPLGWTATVRLDGDDWLVGEARRTA